VIGSALGADGFPRQTAQDSQRAAVLPGNRIDFLAATVVLVAFSERIRRPIALPVRGGHRLVRQVEDTLQIYLSTPALSWQTGFRLSRTYASGDLRRTAADGFTTGSAQQQLPGVERKLMLGRMMDSSDDKPAAFRQPSRIGSERPDVSRPTRLIDAGHHRWDVASRTRVAGGR